MLSSFEADLSLLLSLPFFLPAFTNHHPQCKALTESSYVNVPTIAFANTDSLLRHVDIAIPCNNGSKHAVGLMFWLLAREILYLKGTISRQEGWDVMPDLFFYR